jgi:hypothetical protein
MGFKAGLLERFEERRRSAIRRSHAWSKG